MKINDERCEMAEYNKGKFFWIKLTDSFLSSDTVDFLMSQKDGANYVVLYQMLCLKTVNNNGVLGRNLGEIIVAYDVEKICRDCKYFTIDTVRVALELYKKLGLVYELDNGLLRISNFENLVGSRSIGAEKKRIQLENRKNKPELPEITEGGQKVENFPPEIDIEIEKEKEIDKEIYKEKDIINKPYKSIIDYLNEKVGAKYRASNKATIKHINARLSEGYTVDDFKTVIDKKCAEWKGTNMENYLRPETLFGTKFDSYLNSKGVITDEQIKRNVAENKFANLPSGGLNF